MFFVNVYTCGVLPRNGGKSVASTQHDLQPLGDVAPLETDQLLATFQGSLNRYRYHDPYCAIHDEYGTCTCGASVAEAILVDALGSCPEPIVVQILTNGTSAPARR